MPRKRPDARRTVRRPSLTVRRRNNPFAMQQPQQELGAGTGALKKVKDIEPPELPPDRWQHDAYTFASVIGEVGYIMHLTANTVSLCNLVAITEDEEGVEQDSTDERVKRVMDAFVPPRGGQAELLRRAAMHMQIAGESWLLGTPLKDDAGVDGGLIWEFLSVAEVKVEGKNKVKRNKTGLGRTEGFVDVDSFAARMWREDALYSDRSDSPLKRVSTICREIVLLTQVVDAIAKSRLAAGLLFIPWEMSLGPRNEWEDPGATSDIDPLERELISHLRAAVEDRTSAASLVPLLLRGPADLFGKWGVVELARDLDHLYQSLREEALQRLAGGLDIPLELMNGKNRLSHWTAYNIDDEFIGRHVVPLGNLIADFVTTAYLRPMLKTQENMTQEEVDQFELKFDPSKIQSRADVGPTARAAFNNDAYSIEAYLRDSGLDPHDQPDDVELARKMLQAAFKSNPAVLGPAILPFMFPDDKVIADAVAAWPDMTPAAPDSGVVGKNQTPSRPPGPGNPNNDPGLIGNLPGADPTPNPETPGRPGGHPAAPGEGENALVERLTALADGELDQMLEIVKNRLVAKLHGKNASLARRVASARAAEALTKVSQRDLRTYRVDPEELTAGVTDRLEGNVTGMVAEYLIGTDEMPRHLAVDQARAVSAKFCGLLREHIMSATVRPLAVDETGSRVPARMVQLAFEASHGVDIAA